jgi:hypothetical protein
MNSKSRKLRSFRTAVALVALGGLVSCLSAVAAAALSPIPPTSISLDGKTATFLQDDGFTLVLKTNKGKFTPANFRFVPNSAGAVSGTLQLVDVSFATAGNTFKNATLTTRVEKAPFPGAAPEDGGYADIGYLNATGVDLGGFTLRGDLGQIDAGDADYRTTGMGKLVLNSFGAKAATTQPVDAGLEYLKSTIVGRLESLVVSNYKDRAGRWILIDIVFPETGGFFAHAFLDVVADGNPAHSNYGTIGSIVIDNLSPRVLLSESVPATQVSLSGEVTFAAGCIRAGGRIGSAAFSYVNGGPEAFSGSLWSRTGITSVVENPYPGGFAEVEGGDGDFSGSLVTGSPDNAAITSPGAKSIGSTRLRTLTGGGGKYSGAIYSEGTIGNLRFEAVHGGAGERSGSIVAFGNLGAVVLNAMLGGAGPQSGSILAKNAVSITAKVGLASGSSASGYSGIFLNGTVGTLTIGELASPTGYTGVIVARGISSAAGVAKPGVAIDKLTMPFDNDGANIKNWTVAAGFGWDVNFATNNLGASFNPYASIGAVSVGGNVQNFVIAAGTLPGPNGVFGSAVNQPSDDLHMEGPALPGVYSKISSIVIKGSISAGAFEAQQIGSLRQGATAVTLKAGPLNDNFVVNGLGARVREL